MTQVNLKIKSGKLSMKAQVCVLLPEQGFNTTAESFYMSGEKYKVLWLLHGATCDFEDFLMNDNINNMLRGHKTIVVMPSGLNSDYANHMEFANGFAFTDFFFEELMPFIYSTFPASEKREDNYIAGYSMGGAGALLLGFLHPEKFTSIAPLGSSLRESEFLQPYLNMTGTEFRAFAEANRTALPTEFGDPKYGITLKEINMIARYPAVKDYVDSVELTWDRFSDVLAGGALPEMYFCCGNKDGCYPAVLKFVKYAKSLGAENVSCDTIPDRGHDCEKEAIDKMLKHFGL